METSIVTSIYADVENGNSDIASVKLMNFKINTVLAEGIYADGRMKIDLPDSLESEFLYSLDYDLKEGITISCTDVQMVGDYYVILVAYDNSGKQIGRFNYRSLETGAEGIFNYVDRNVVLKGSGIDGTTNYVYSVSFKKGWNFVYGVEKKSQNDNTVIVTTSTPSGMKWYFEER
jgi:hypothetical protein